MHHRRQSLLLHPLFIGNLLVLLLNDFFGKEEYHNWLTGKLSDFSGVFVLMIILAVLFPGKKTMMAFGVAVCFTWWKSSLADSFLYWCNHTIHLPVTRVTDYSDLFALAMLPLACSLRPVFYPDHLLYRYSKYFLGVFSVFAITADSLPRMMPYMLPGGYVNINKTYTTKLTPEDILKKLDSLHISWKRDSVEFFPVTDHNYYLLGTTGNDTARHLMPLKEFPDTILYYRHATTPYYSIQKLILAKDTVRDIRFSIENSGRKRRVILMSLIAPVKSGSNYYYYQKLARKYKTLINSFLEE